MNKNMIYTTLFLAALVYVLHATAVKFSLYFALWWYDMPMHFLGGMVIGGLSAWLVFSLQHRFPGMSDSRAVFFILAMIAVGGIVWEIFEYLLDIFYNPRVGYFYDTFKDLVLDLAGGILMVAMYHTKKLQAFFSNER